MCDNLRANEACFNLNKEKFGSSVIFSCKHPLENEVFENFHLLYDPTHLLKTIHNNCRLKKDAETKFYLSINK